jgi:hypothetical protein
MKKTKHDSLITTNKEGPIPDWLRKLREKVPDDPSRGRVLTWVDNGVMPGAFYYESFIVPGKKELPANISYCDSGQVCSKPSLKTQ